MSTHKNGCARALDLGFGFTKYSRGHTNRDLSLDVGVFPSYAAPAVDDSLGAGVLKNLNVVTVEVDGARYNVGEDAKNAGSGQARQLLERSFFTSPQYLALAKGALTFMDVPPAGISVLTVGLPLTTFGDEDLRQAIEQRLSGSHDIPCGGETRTVDVKRINLIPQVLGSLIALALPTGRMTEIQAERNLTIDVGYGTLLWLMTEGLKPVPARSSGNMGGVSSLLQAVVRSIDASAASNVGILERVDQALLHGHTAIKVNGKTVELSQHSAHLGAAISENLTEMLRSIGSASDVDNVFLTGGGAHLYRDALRKAFPGREITEARDGSQFTNVRGFQLLSERLLHA